MKREDAIKKIIELTAIIFDDGEVWGKDTNCGTLGEITNDIIEIINASKQWLYVRELQAMEETDRRLEMLREASEYRQECAFDDQEEEDIQEGLKVLTDEKGTITWEQYQLKRKEKTNV